MANTKRLSVSELSKRLLIAEKRIQMLCAVLANTRVLVAKIRYDSTPTDLSYTGTSFRLTRDGISTKVGLLGAVDFPACSVEALYEHKLYVTAYPA